MLCNDQMKNLPLLPFTVLPPFFYRFYRFTGLPFFSIYRFYRFTVLPFFKKKTATSLVGSNLSV